MDWKKHICRAGSFYELLDDLPSSPDEVEKFCDQTRKQVEPWLSAVFQAEHLNLLIGSGFTAAIGAISGATATGMSKINIGGTYGKAIDTHAETSARTMGRGSANIEDQLRSALAVLDGLSVIDKSGYDALKKKIDEILAEFLKSLLATERGIHKSSTSKKRDSSNAALQSFLLSFASRAASRERLHVFTTNYDRLIEHGCDIAGLRIIDRFVGALNPIFRASRIEVDMHYNPPGIRGEPRFMEGVIRLTKLHGSLDWAFDKEDRHISRRGIPFGAVDNHTDIPDNPIDTVMIYPNPAKDVETTQYPYAELFRDFASAVCRPNAVVVTYGYGFGDDHINRVLLDMLTIPSTHLVLISYGAEERIKAFLDKTRPAQVSLLIGSHFGDLGTLIDNYLPKPALDYITGRMAELMKSRPIDPSTSSSATSSSGGAMP